MAKYNGHKNWNHWNVSLWINNDEGLHRLAQEYVQTVSGGRLKAAEHMQVALARQGITRTPDGAPYSMSSIRAAMVGM
jgi:hypothetical protein